MRERLVLNSFRLNVIIKNHKYILTKIHWYQNDIIFNNSENAIMKYILFGIRKVAGGGPVFVRWQADYASPNKSTTWFEIRKEVTPVRRSRPPDIFLILN